MTTASDLPPLFRADSLAEQAYRAIREGIATGLFSAGERVTERGLAARLNVSATPVREALRRLEQEGLIERIPGITGIKHAVGSIDHDTVTLMADPPEDFAVLAGDDGLGASRSQAYRPDECAVRAHCSCHHRNRDRFP